MFFYRLGRSFALMWLTLVLVACAGSTGSSDSTNQSSNSCGDSPELITDPLFTTINDLGSRWEYNQHAGDRSFTVDAEEGAMIFERIGAEPWAFLVQTITDGRLDGATIRYTADLRGDVSTDVNHLFGAKAGLFLRLGKHPDAFMGDQDPSTGQWDWQTFSVTKTVPVGENSISVGFIHQAGEGAIEARNPSLVLLDCLE
jgi:hypothetical protein